MDEAIIAVVLSAVIQIVGLIANSNLTKYRIEQLEKKVDKHNNLVVRMVAVEQSAQYTRERLDDMLDEINGLERRA